MRPCGTNIRKSPVDDLHVFSDVISTNLRFEWPAWNAFVFVFVSLTQLSVAVMVRRAINNFLLGELLFLLLL